MLFFFLFFFSPSRRKQAKEPGDTESSHTLCDLKYLTKIHKLIVSAAWLNSVNHQSNSSAFVFVENRSLSRPLPLVPRRFTVLITTTDAFLSITLRYGVETVVFRLLFLCFFRLMQDMENPQITLCNKGDQHYRSSPSNQSSSSDPGPCGSSGWSQQPGYDGYRTAAVLTVFEMPFRSM